MQPTEKKNEKRKPILSKVVINKDDPSYFETPFKNTSLIKSLDQNTVLESLHFEKNLKYLWGKEPDSDKTLDSASSKRN